VRHLFLAMGSLLALAACGQQAPKQTEGGDPNWKPPKAAVEVPKAIQKIATAPFSADGKVHVLASEGQIVIKPDTPTCYFPDGFSVDNSRLFDALKQPNHFKGSGRIQPAAKGSCKFTKDVVLFNGLRTINSNGYSKFVLSVWQGSVSTSEGAYWVGGLERTEGVNPKAADMKADEYTSLEEVRRGGSASYDQGDLSDAFVAYVSRGKGK
jgi:hypothetical protein